MKCPTTVSRMIRKATFADVPALLNIYNHYVRETVITFDIVEWELTNMEQHFHKITQSHPYLVCEEQGEVLGYAYANVWKEKDAYQQTCETTIYLKHGISGRGIGSKLYIELIEKLRARGIRVIIACITVPNDASIAIHEKFGFQKVAIFKQLGKKFGILHDVGYWQLTL